MNLKNTIGRIIRQQKLSSSEARMMNAYVEEYRHTAPGGQKLRIMRIADRDYVLGVPTAYDDGVVILELFSGSKRVISKKPRLLGELRREDNVWTLFYGRP